MADRLSSPILVGRAAELATLDVALRRAAEGHPAVVVIGGDAGIGKTRLVAEFSAGARQAGARVYAGACLDLDGEGLPYGPFLECLRGIGRDRDPADLALILGQVGAELALLAPGFARFVGAEQVPEPDGGPTSPAMVANPGDQVRLFELTLALIERLGAIEPFVLVLEDLHWGDPASRDLLAFLARNLRHERAMVVATFRTEDLERGHPLLVLLAELGRLPIVERIDLKPLGLSEQREMLAAILGRRPSTALVERIHDRAEGNPFFAEELLAAVDRPPALGAAEFAPDRRGAPPPRSLRDILLGRITGLAETTQRILRAVAVAGAHADDELVAELTGLTDDEVTDGVREAIERHVLEVDPATDRYRFRHALLAEVVAAELLPGERKRLHGEVARHLSGVGGAGGASGGGMAGATAAELAHHWATAGVEPEALTASIEAARAATAVHAHADAHRQAERALALWPRVDDAAERTGIDRVELLLMAASSADLAGRGDRAVALAREAIEAVDEAAEPIRVALIRSRLAYYLWTSGESQASIAEHRAAIALIPAEPPTAERARVVGGLAAALMPTGKYRESMELAEEAIATLRAAKSHDGEARLLNVLGVDLVGLGDIEAGLDHLRVAVRLARESGPPEILLGALHNLAFFLAQTDRFEEGLRLATDGIETARRIGLERRYGAGFLASAGDILHRSGRWDEADALTREGIDLDVDPSGSIYLQATRAMILAARGDRAGVTEALASADRLAEGDIDPDVQAYLLQARAEAALIEGRPADALRAIQEALEAFAGSDEILLVAPLLVAGLTAAADIADDARAFRDTKRLASAQRTGEVLAGQVRAIAGDGADDATRTPSLSAAIATAEAETGRLEGTSDAARWLAAADAWAAVPMPYPAARARARAGEAILLARGPRDEAARQLRAGHAVALELGAAPLAAAIAAIAGRARVELEAAETEADAAATAAAEAAATEAAGPAVRNPAEILGLSAREWEVLELVAAGRSNGEIAETLYISPKTASVHVTHILDKLGVSNRVEAATIAVRVAAGEPRPGESSRTDFSA